MSDLTTLQNSREAVQLLLIHGADVNQIDEKRQTALHHATILGHTDLACLLLKKGADHRRVNTDNKVLTEFVLWIIIPYFLQTTALYTFIKHFNVVILKHDRTTYTFIINNFRTLWI